MKSILKVFAFVLMAGTMMTISCKKERSCENCVNGNQPPIAIVGPDQVITLPTDSISLDGNASNDPDGKISAWLWTKISGPASFAVIKSTDSITKVKSLIAGIYLFELKVTDNGGLSVKDTVQVIVNDPAQINRAPVANAGADQIVTLPTNTVNLNGSASTDPDNNITNYGWAKLSGPFSFTIANPNAVQTQVTNLVQGTYQFELMVTDSGGLFSRDTIQVLVNASGNSTNISVTGCNANMTPFGHLSQPGMVYTIVSASSKIFFYASIGINGGFTNIYDTVTKTWSTSNLYYGNINVGNKLLTLKNNYPINQELFEVYDASTDTRSTHITPEARGNINYTLAGNKIIFYEGSNLDSSYIKVSKRLDIYDAGLNSWSLVYFNEARYGMGAVSFGNKVFFAGGFKVRYDSLIQSCDDSGLNCVIVPAIVPVSRIDIYDLSTNSWSVASLSEPRGGITTAVAGNKILFVGGGSSTRVDIYDATSHNWSTAQLSDYIYDQSGRKRAHVVGSKVLFTRLWSKTVDIYDAGNNSWSTAQMSQPNGQTDYAVSSAGNKIVFFTVFDLEGISKNIDIYDASANTWCHAELTRSLVRSGIISIGNKIYIAGGQTKSNPNGTYDQLVDDVWNFNF